MRLPFAPQPVRDDPARLPARRKVGWIADFDGVQNPFPILIERQQQVGGRDTVGHSGFDDHFWAQTPDCCVLHQDLLRIELRALEISAADDAHTPLEVLREAKVPRGFIDSTSLLGPKERIAEKMVALAESGVTTLTVSVALQDLERGTAALRVAAEALDKAGVGD